MTKRRYIVEPIDDISIHIPLARYDEYAVRYPRPLVGISIHIPLARYDHENLSNREKDDDFNPHTARAV